RGLGLCGGLLCHDGLSVIQEAVRAWARFWGMTTRSGQGGGERGCFFVSSLDGLMMPGGIEAAKSRMTGDARGPGCWLERWEGRVLSGSEHVWMVMMVVRRAGRVLERFVPLQGRPTKEKVLWRGRLFVAIRILPSGVNSWAVLSSGVGFLCLLL